MLLRQWITRWRSEKAENRSNTRIIISKWEDIDRATTIIVCMNPLSPRNRLNRSSPLLLKKRKVKKIESILNKLEFRLYQGLRWYWVRCWRLSDIQEMIKMMETPENFKQIYLNMVFWLQPSREIWVCATPFLQFLRQMGSRDSH